MVFQIPAGDGGSAALVSCQQNKMNAMLLSTIEESTGDTHKKAADFAKCTKSFEFVIVAVIAQHIVGFVKAVFLELRKSTVAMIPFKHRLMLIAQRLSSANKELKLYTVFAFIQAYCGHWENATTLHRNHARRL